MDSNKSVDIPVPTKTSDLDNDSGYMTEDQVNSKVTEGVGVILEDIDEINSNLVVLEYSDIAGGKNIIDVKDVALSTSGNVFDLDVNFENNQYTLSFDVMNIGGSIDCRIIKSNGDITKKVYSDSGHKTISHNGDVKRIYIYSNSSVSIKNIQFEVGTETSYEPYIMSNKQLTVQNESLSDYGITEIFDGVLTQYGDGKVYGTTMIPCTNGDTVTVICDGCSNITISYFDNNVSLVSSDSINDDKLISKVPANATQGRFILTKSGITPENAPRVSLYINNEIDVLKNDLNELCNIEKVFTNENTTYTYTASEMHLENDHIYDIFLKGNYPTAGSGCCKVFIKNNQYVLFTIAAKYIEFSMDPSNGTLTVTNKYDGTQGTQLIVKKVV